MPNCANHESNYEGRAKTCHSCGQPILDLNKLKDDFYEMKSEIDYLKKEVDKISKCIEQLCNNKEDRLQVYSSTSFGRSTSYGRSASYGRSISIGKHNRLSLKLRGKSNAEVPIVELDSDNCKDDPVWGVR